MFNRWKLMLPALAALGCGEEKDGGGESCPEEPGVICTWAGTGEALFNGDGLPLEESGLYWPIDVTFTRDGTAYVLDWNNHRVRKVTTDGTFQTVIGTDFLGDGPLDLSDQKPEGAPGTEVLLNHPTQFVEMPDDSLMLVAWHNHKLRRYDPETGRVTVVCGGPAGFAGDGGPARMGRLDQPVSAALDAEDNLYVLDQRNQIIRKIAADSTMSTVAGTRDQVGFEGDGGDPLMAKMNQPDGSNPKPGGTVAIADDGRLYFTDVLNHRIRRVDFEANTIETVAGNGEAGFGGDGGPAVEAKLNNPRKLAFGPDGRLYVGDERNNRIRAIDLESGKISTVAGNGEAVYEGDGGLATEASLARPAGVTFHGGFMYIIDTYNNAIRRVKL